VVARQCGTRWACKAVDKEGDIVALPDMQAARPYLPPQLVRRPAVHVVLLAHASVTGVYDLYPHCFDTLPGTTQLWLCRF